MGNIGQLQYSIIYSECFDLYIYRELLQNNAYASQANGIIIAFNMVSPRSRSHESASILLSPQDKPCFLETSHS